MFLDYLERAIFEVFEIQVMLVIAIPIFKYLVTDRRSCGASPEIVKGPLNIDQCHPWRLSHMFRLLCRPEKHFPKFDGLSLNSI